jgi:hypothetical protein
LRLSSAFARSQLARGLGREACVVASLGISADFAQRPVAGMGFDLVGRRPRFRELAAVPFAKAMHAAVFGQAGLVAPRAEFTAQAFRLVGCPGPCVQERQVRGRRGGDGRLQFGGDFDLDLRPRLGLVDVNDTVTDMLRAEPGHVGAARGVLGYYVGVGRLPEAPDRVIRVTARRFGTGDEEFSIDYLSVYAICAEEPEVSRRLDHCLTVYSDEPPVVAHEEASWSPLIALAYIKALHTLIQRHLRRGFIEREETMHGRVRGQIDVRRYFTRSLARGHPEMTPCRFQGLEQDTLENRILRTALVGASRVLERATGRSLPRRRRGVCGRDKRRLR